MKTFSDGMELTANLASPRMFTSPDPPCADLSQPWIAVSDGAFEVGQAEIGRLVRGGLFGGADPVVLFCPAIDPAALGMLLAMKLRGALHIAVALTDEAATVAEATGAQPFSTPQAVTAKDCLGRAARAAVSGRRTWLWTKRGAGSGSVQTAFDAWSRRMAEALAAPFTVPVARVQGPALESVAGFGAPPSAKPFEGTLLPLGSTINAQVAGECLELARAVLPKVKALVIACPALDPEGGETLRAGLAAARGPVLVAAGCDEQCLESLAAATGGRAIHGDFMLPASAVRVEDLGTFRNARPDGGGLSFEGRADAKFVRIWLRTLNRDYLAAESDAEREACRSNCETFLCALEPALRLEVLKRT